MDFTNKGLALIVVVAIVISLGGTIVSLNRLNKLNPHGFTGLVTSGNATGTANFSLQTNVVITFVNSLVNFGSGYVELVEQLELL